MKTYIAPLSPPIEVAGDKPAVYVRMWYDTSERIWTILQLDEEFNQLGNADYAFGCHGFAEARKHAEGSAHRKLKFTHDHPKHMNTPLPPAAFSNAMNDIKPGFDFTNWHKTPEWKVFVAGYNMGTTDLMDKAKQQLDLKDSPWAAQRLPK